MKKVLSIHLARHIVPHELALRYEVPPVLSLPLVVVRSMEDIAVVRLERDGGAIQAAERRRIKCARFQ